MVQLEEPTVETSQVPVSLGKPSLRVRLEAYYSLIDPERLQDGTKWRQIFDEVYTKYGGTYTGERRLSSKLTKKYGSRVKLFLAEQTQKKHEESTTLRFDESCFVGSRSSRTEQLF
ncbi:unnamed protein product [Cylindrotheca closterium]|uniref:Uncharacterized protein n=1 Tax=Cylindrotheca closterium TaxID=2856 RepID=A0AAD2FYX7_9STRA|nr:unnamed protein product [Cylindrotheca closterium]